MVKNTHVFTVSASDILFLAGGFPFCDSQKYANAFIIFALRTD